MNAKQLQRKRNDDFILFPIADYWDTIPYQIHLSNSIRKVLEKLVSVQHKFDVNYDDLI